MEYTSFLEKSNILKQIPEEVLSDFILTEKIWACLDLLGFLIAIAFFATELKKLKDKEWDFTPSPLFLIACFVMLIRVLICLCAGTLYSYVELFFNENLYLIKNFDVKSYKW